MYTATKPITLPYYKDTKIICEYSSLNRPTTNYLGVNHPKHRGELTAKVATRQYFRPTERRRNYSIKSIGGCNSRCSTLSTSTVGIGLSKGKGKVCNESTTINESTTLGLCRSVSRMVLLRVNASG